MRASPGGDVRYTTSPRLAPGHISCTPSTSGAPAYVTVPVAVPPAVTVTVCVSGVGVCVVRFDATGDAVIVYVPGGTGVRVCVAESCWLYPDGPETSTEPFTPAPRPVMVIVRLPVSTEYTTFTATCVVDAGSCTVCVVGAGRYVTPPVTTSAAVTV